MTKDRLSDGFWASILQWARLGANALVLVIVARFLTLEEIGIFATAAAPSRFFQVIHKSGIEESVVIGRDGADLDALFVLSLAASAIVVLTTLIVGAVVLLVWPAQAELAAILVVLSLTSVAFGFGSIPDGILRKAANFRILALRTLAAQGVAVIATAFAVFAGFGAWSLVVFTLTNAVLAAAISVASTGWRPSWRWPDQSSLRPAFQSVSTLSGRVLIGAAVQPILQIGVGACAGLAAAGVFQIAQRILALMEAVTLAPLRFLNLPRFSKLSEDSVALRASVLGSLRVAGLVSAWVYLGVFGAAPDFLTLLIGGSNAAETVSVLRILCLTGLAAAGAAVINQALIGAGLGAVAFQVSIFMAVVTLGLAVPALGNPNAIAASLVMSGLTVFAIMLWQVPRWFGISTIEAAGAVGLPYLAGAIMAAGVIALDIWLWAEWPLFLRLVGQITLGSAIYIAALWVLMPRSFPSFRHASPA